MNQKTSYIVIFGDTDAGGVVYHARYLEIAERGRNEAGRSVGLDVGELFKKRRLALALRSVAMAFHAPAVFDDILILDTHIEKLGAASATWVTRIQKGDKPICTVRAEMICIDLTAHAPKRFPEDVRCAMQQLTTNH